jgi:hypothetical protein
MQLKNLILSIVLTGLCTTVTAQRTYNLTYEGAKLIQNEHVGNEWARGVWLGEEALERNQPVRLAAGTTYELSIAAAETKEKYNDRGDESVELTPTLLARLLPEGGFYLDVTVMERNGRYAGGKAIWRFYFDLE